MEEIKKRKKKQQRFITVKNVTEEKKAQKLNLISYANKINNYNIGRKKKKKNPKESTEQIKKIRIINVFLESLLSESFPVLGVTVHLTSLGCPPILC